jgi:hypothetical protein
MTLSRRGLTGPVLAIPLVPSLHRAAAEAQEQRWPSRPITFIVTSASP